MKFAEGLAKIDVQNQVVFLFDNDAEGLDAQRRLSRLTLPANMRGTLLPELERRFEHFQLKVPRVFERQTSTAEPQRSNVI